MKKSIFYIVMFFFLQVFALAVAWTGNRLTNGAGASMSVTWAIVMQAVFTISCIIVFLWRRWSPIESFRLILAKTPSLGMSDKTPYSEERRTSKRLMRLSAWALLAWATLAALGSIVPSMWLQEHLSFLPDLTSDDMMELIHHPLGYFIIGILAPLSEEIVFRGAILRELLCWLSERPEESGSMPSSRSRSWMAICLSALFFAAAHMNPAQMPHAFLLGVLLGWLYWRTGSIVPGLVVHVVNNTVAFILARAYPYMDDLTLEQLFGGSQRHVLMAIGFSLCLLLPALFQLHQRMPHRRDDQ